LMTFAGTTKFLAPLIGDEFGARSRGAARVPRASGLAPHPLR